MFCVVLVWLCFLLFCVLLLWFILLGVVVLCVCCVLFVLRVFDFVFECVRDSAVVVCFLCFVCCV